MDEATLLTGLRAALADGVLAASKAPDDVPALTIRPEALLPLVRTLRGRPYGLDVLLDLTCLDDPASAVRFTVVYHFASFAPPARLRIKLPAAGDAPAVDSLTPFWANAAWLEREVYDLFGVRFKGHPDLRRLMLHEGFAGHPLRKDYPARRRQPVAPEEEAP